MSGLVVRQYEGKFVKGLRNLSFIGINHKGSDLLHT